MIVLNRWLFQNLAFIFICCAIILLVGCSQRIADLTLVSTKNIDLSNATLDIHKGKRVKGEDCKPVFIIPLGEPNLEAAIDDALNKGNGNVMVDQVSYVVNKSFLIGAICIEVEGTVLNTATLSYLSGNNKFLLSQKR